MANTTKKYYWLKLKEDFFEDDTIEWIEEQPNGEKYSLFYLKLCLKSLKTDGVLIRNVGEMLIPYDVKKLAEITKTDVDTVRVAMELFKNIGLIQILENGEIYMSQLKNMVGCESKWAEKKRIQRAKDKQKTLEEPKKDGGNNVTEALPNRYTEIEQEQEQEKEIEIELTDRQKDNVLNVSQKSPREKEQEKEKEKDKEKEIELTDRQRERVELLRELFAGWSVNDNQIFYISSLINDRLPYTYVISERDLMIYDNLDRLIKKAKADSVKHIYRWLEKVIPEVDIY